MYGDRMTPCTPSGTMDRYTIGANPGGGGGRGGGGGGIGGGGGAMDRYASRTDGWSPPEMEISHCCRTFLMSRLRAAERMNEQLSEDAKNTNSSRLRSIRPPGEFNVDLAIEQLRAQVASLLDADIGVIRQLLFVNEQMEELRWQRKYGGDGGGGSPWTPSTLLSGSCTADIDSVDFDPDDIDPLNDPRDPVRPHDDVINGCFGGDDVTDDVFQNDQTQATARHLPPPSNNTCMSSEVRFKVMPSGLKVNSPDKDKVNRSKVEVMVKDPKNVDDSKTSKVEFRVNNKKVTGDSGKVIGSTGEVKVKGVDEINDRLKTTKVEFKVETTKPSSSQVQQIRFLVNSDDARGQGQSSDSEGHSKGMAATEVKCQTGAAHSSQHTPHASRDVKPSSGPIRKQREMKAENGPQLRIMNLGSQGIRMGHAGITTPAKVKVTPFSMVDDNEESETIVVHL